METHANNSELRLSGDYSCSSFEEGCWAVSFPPPWIWLAPLKLPFKDATMRMAGSHFEKWEQ